MEFSVAELIAIGALILNLIIYFSRVPTRKDLSDLRTELRNEIGGLRSEIGDVRNELRNEIGGLRSEIGDLRTELRSEIGELRSEIGDVRNELRNEITESRSEMNVRFSKLDEAFTNHLMFMHSDSRQTPTQGEDK